MLSSYLYFTRNNYISNKWYCFSVIDSRIFSNSLKLLNSSYYKLVDLSAFFRYNTLTVFFFTRISSLNQPILLISPLVKKSAHKLMTTTNWLFREFNEFFYPLFLHHNDSRNLLLDYKVNSYPLRKEFSCSSGFDLNFNLNTNKVFWYKSYSVEL